MKNLLLTLKVEKKFLLALLCFSFCIRFLAFILFFGKDKNYWNLDTIAYNEVALQISEGKGFTNADGTNHFYRLPAYPTFLSVCYYLFGPDIKKALIVQLFLASFIPILIFLLCLAVFPLQLFLAKIVALVCAVHLGFILYSCIAMSESLFMLFFLPFLILFLSNFETILSFKKTKLKTYKLFLAGLFLGCASLVRPVGHYLIILSLLMLVLSNDNFYTAIKKIISVVLGWVLVVSPWLVRNFLLTGHIFFHTLPGVHFLRYSATPILMKTQNLSYSEAWGKLIVQWQEENLKTPKPVLEIHKCKNAEKIAITYLKNNPLLAARYALFNIFKTCIGLYSSELLYVDQGLPEHCFEKGRNFWKIFERFIFPKTSNFLLKIIIYFEIIFLFLILLGFILEALTIILTNKNLNELLKVMPFIIVFIAITLASGFARVRLPIEPFLIMFSLNYWLKLIIVSRSSLKKKLVHV